MVLFLVHEVLWIQPTLPYIKTTTATVPEKLSDDTDTVEHTRWRSEKTCNLFKRTRNVGLPLTGDRSQGSGNLNIYPSRDGSKQFVLCAYPKTGCSQWVMLLRYLVNGQKSTSNPHDVSLRVNTMLKQDSACLDSMDVPRILIMRDPYERAQSSYHDFNNRAMKSKNGQAVSTFEEYVMDYVRDGGKKVNDQTIQSRDHRLPISSGCSPSWASGGWDFVLQLEQMALWLPCMLEMLNLTHIVGSGWGNTSLFHLPHVSFEEALYIALKGGRKDLVKSIKTGHESVNATDLHTPKTIEVVNSVFHNDFVLGGYRMRG